MRLRLRLLVVRAVLGVLFFGHGTQKLFGWFGGHGPSGTGQFFDQLGIRPGRRNALIAGTAEAVGGGLLVAGLLTPLAGASLSSVMITAIRKVHGGKGPWIAEGGYEYNLVLLATIFALTEAGPGPVSLDRVLGSERCGTGWALAQLAAGAAGSELIIRLGESRSPTEEAEVASEPPVPADAPARRPPEDVWSGSSEAERVASAGPTVGEAGKELE
jgi:putative oxidoreductase